MQERKNHAWDESLNIFWDKFFQDNFREAYKIASQIKASAQIQSEYDQALELQAKVLLKQGDFLLAQKTIAESKKVSAFKLFLNFLLDANPKPLLEFKASNYEDKIYQAQCTLLSRIYWGNCYLESINLKLDPDELLEEVFSELIEKELYDRAILASVQSLELMLEDQIISHDIHLPVMREHIDNLVALSAKVKYNSTKAKLFLVKAKVFKDREAAEDAEILFGKEQNLNGLAETYMVYAKDFEQEEYYEKALELFAKCENDLARGYIFESIASMSLMNGNIQDAKKAFKKAQRYLKSGGIFEKLGLQVQEISLMAISGKYQKVKESVHEIIKPHVPSFFIAQAYQILANTLIQIGEDIELARGYIEAACDIFKNLKRYNQLLYTQNVHFQILLLENDLEQIQTSGQEIIQLASRLGNEEIKASKYLDLAFVTIRISLEDGNLDDTKLVEVEDYFKKAIRLFQEQENFLGEADSYQAMGNMYTSIGKLEEALNSFLTAKKLYQAERVHLQAAVTDTLIGILMLNYVVLNQQTYPIAQRHFEQALVYFSKENLLDLAWKTTFYIADLNHRYYQITKNSDESMLYKNKAKNYYLEMLLAIQDYQEDAPDLRKQSNLVGVTIKDACQKAYEFFLSIGESDNASKFKQN